MASIQPVVITFSQQPYVARGWPGLLQDCVWLSPGELSEPVNTKQINEGNRIVQFIEELETSHRFTTHLVFLTDVHCRERGFDRPRKFEEEALCTKLEFYQT